MPKAARRRFHLIVFEIEKNNSISEIYKFHPLGTAITQKEKQGITAKENSSATKNSPTIHKCPAI